MTAIEDIINATDLLTEMLEKLANQKKLSDDAALQLERYSWDMYRLANDLRAIEEYIL